MIPKVNKFKVFIDCGAPSLYEKLSKNKKSGVMGSKFSDRKYNRYDYANTDEYYEYMQQYIDFINTYKEQIDLYSNLDVISNPSLTHRNQRLLEAASVSPIPIFHLGSDEKWLKRYVDKYDYIAIGGLVPNPTSTLIPILDRIWKDYLTDDKGYPRVKVHGFACTSLELMRRYPWYSVDSASSHKLALYGKITIPHKDGIGLSHISISTRDTPLKYKVSPYLFKQIEVLSEEYGVIANNLLIDMEERLFFNHMSFLKAVEFNVPKWPWSFITRKSKGDDILNLYYAGNFSKQGFPIFLKKLQAANIPAYRICRLTSFFYKKECERTLEFKSTDKII